MRHLTEIAGAPLTDNPPATWIFDRVQEWAGRFPNRFAFALDHQNGVQEYRYADVLTEAHGVAAGLKARGFRAGDRVGILMENIPQWVFVLLGNMRLGVVTVPLATALPEDHLVRIVKHSGIRIIVTDDTNIEKARTIARETECDVLPLSDWETFVIRDPKVEFPKLVDPQSTVLLIYTSGTTGDPKGVQLSMLNLIYEVRGIVEPFELSPDHRILSVLPFSHVLPLVANALGPLCIGAGVVFLSSVSPQRIIEAFHKHRITCFVCVPQFFYLLHKRIFSQVNAQSLLMRKIFGFMRALSARINSAAFRRKLFSRIHKAIGPDLRLFASGGSKFDVRIANELSELGYVMLNAYGLTETSAAVTATPVRHNRIGSVGKPIRGVRIKIESPNPEGIGEVCIAGPLLMKGYYLDETRTSEVIRDGWLHSGDLGMIDLDGNLTITGRSKDVIVLANGKNIYPEEIETHYGQSPYIKEICVLGISEDGGEKLHAVVVPDMDEFRNRGQSTIMAVIRFDMENLSKSLPSYQHILSISIRNDPFPRTATRKLKRFEIQKQEEEKQQAAAETVSEDHERFKSGIGQTVAKVLREVKRDVVGLRPDLNLELDLGLDSLSRVELLTELEARTGHHLDEEKATRIFTLGELLDALEQQTDTGVSGGKGWKEILAVSSSDALNDHYIFKAKPISTSIILTLCVIVRLLSRFLFRLRWRGLENIPSSGPFLLCPNHESFLDAPMLYTVLPFPVIRNIFSVGYSDYWEGALTRRIAESCNIVAIDPDVNLVRALQAGAVGLKRNKVLLIFPEGTRSIDGHIGELKKGAAILSSELTVPIIPVGINGTFEAWPRFGGFKFRPIEIVFGARIDPDRFRDRPDPYGALTEHLRNIFKTLTYDTR